jgi:gliding motility-associated-like protein
VLFMNMALAQITVEDNQTAEALVESLVGEGVTISNATLNCNGAANGLFSGVSNLGIESGIILTSGSAIGVVGPNNGGPGPDAVYNLPGDPDLNGILAGITSQDACVLEFDFVPSGDTVSFNYVFASTEYQSWSCSSFNDVFAFLISGPGYTAPFNIATIPGTSIPICVNSTTGVTTGTGCTSLGPGSPFSEYYVNNINGATIAYGGFTTPFTAVAQVVPCETYHLKLAIADGTDWALDSGVFLEAGSLSSPSISSDSESGQGVETPYSSTVRGCPPAKLIISRSGSTSIPLTVHYNILGDAINGVDYVEIPDSVTIPAGQSSVTLDIQGLIVNPATGPKQAIFEILSPYICGGTSGNVVDRDTITIFDSLHVNIVQNDTAICLGASAQLTVEGEVYYSYQWTPAATVSNPNGTNVTVTPTVPTTYIVQAWIQGVVCPPATDQIFINVEPGPELNVGPDLVLCTYDTVYLYAAVTPTTNDYTYEWHPGVHLSDSTSDMAIYANDYPGQESIIVSATTAVGCKGVDTINITVNHGDFLRNVVADTGICPGTVFQYEVTGADSFVWIPSAGLSDPGIGNPIAAPLTSMDYTLYGYRLGCVDSQLIHLSVYPEAMVFLPDSVRIWSGESYQMDPQGNCLYFQWFPPSGLTAADISNPIASPDVRTRYFVQGTSEYGCEAIDSIDVLVEMEAVLDVPNAFTPGNGPNPTFKILRRGEAQLQRFTIFNRWGVKVFETSNIDEGWDGSLNGTAQPMGVYIYHIEATTKSGTPFVKQGNVTLLR